MHISSPLQMYTTSTFEINDDTVAFTCRSHHSIDQTEIKKQRKEYNAMMEKRINRTEKKRKGKKEKEMRRKT